MKLLLLFIAVFAVAYSGLAAAVDEVEKEGSTNELDDFSEDSLPVLMDYIKRLLDIAELIAEIDESRREEDCESLSSRRW